MPDAVVVEPHVARVVDRLIAALHHEAAVEWFQVQVVRGVAKAEAVVEAAFAVLLDHKIGVAGIQQFGHRYQGGASIGAAPRVLVLRRIEVTEPHSGHEVGISRLERVEIALEGQQDERVLLDVVPASPDPVGQQAGHDLRDEIRRGRHRDERIEHDAVGAAAGMQQQVGILAIVRGERGRPGGLDGSVVHDPFDLGLDVAITDHLPEPRQGVQLESFAPAVPQVAGIVGRVLSVQRAHIQRVGHQHVLAALAVFGRDPAFDVLQVPVPVLHHPGRNVEAVVLGNDERVHRLDRRVRA